MPLPLLDHQLVHTFPVLTDESPLCLDSFHFAGADYAAKQPQTWFGSERAWDSGDPAWGTGEQTASDRGFGRWHGPAAYHSGPRELWLNGATAETLGHDDLARLAVDAPLTATWGQTHWQQYMALGAPPKVVSYRVIVQAADGATLLTTTAPPGAAAVGAESFTTFNLSAALLAAEVTLEGGAYILWVYAEQAIIPWRLPDDYLEVRGFTAIPERFKYIEDDVEYIWDYEADVGRRPASQEQESLEGAVMWDEHFALVLGGGLLHRGAWTQFIVSGTPQEGPWSALRFILGEGNWEVEAGFQPASGAVLEELTDEDSRVPVFIDPLALSISAFNVMRVGDKAGEARLGGTIASRSGPFTAYWHFHPGEEEGNATLLGVSERNFVAICEASLYPTVSDIWEMSNGTELILSYSHLHEYSTIPDAVTGRLPGLPRTSLGHPGGRCLRTVGNVLLWFTEYFGTVGAPVADDPFAQFYNTLRQLLKRAAIAEITTGKGTVFHGDNCAEFIWGKFYGIAQDKPFVYETLDNETLETVAGETKQYIAYLDNDVWVSSGMEPFLASTHRWQRIRRIDTPDGIHAVVAGKAATGEGAIWGLADGREFREGSLPFRVRRMTRAKGATGRERLYCVGRFVENGLCSLQQSIIALSGEFVKVCASWDNANTRFAVSRNTATSAGIDLDLLPAFLWWVPLGGEDGGGYWWPCPDAPEDSREYLELILTEFLVTYTKPVAVTMPYDAESQWCRICFVVRDDGSVDPPEIQACATNADEALAEMPVGTEPLFFYEDNLGLPWSAIQINDVNDFVPESRLRELAHQAQFYPLLWIRVDSDAPADDLTTYTQRARFNCFQPLSTEAETKIEAVVLVPPDALPTKAPTIDRKV